MNIVNGERQYILMLDTETANTIVQEDGKLDMSCSLAYDFGWAIVDRSGNIYCRRSFVNADVFLDKSLMKTAYYAEKIPQYWDEIKSGQRVLAKASTIRKIMLYDMREFNTKIVCAHNAYFDYNAMRMTQRWVTKSRFRYWLPYGVEIWDTMSMARQIIAKMPSYRQFCKVHNLYSSQGRISLTAENLYRFITKNPDFVEKHTAFEDVEIEVAILAFCFRQRKPMRTKLFRDKT
ncbi:MAG: hypothetical protein IKU45_02060 [Clostridia bacterium]|nr:hypothetical protein [Clostridia bacterium]